jgi:competence ComEA-like helix-hairpin-helix protein
MSELELRSLRRAAFVLVVLSLARWATSRPRTPADALRVEDVAERHARETRAAADEEALRQKPLAQGETIDPNRASEAELDRLPGVGPATARAIVAVRDSGVVFSTPGDLAAVRGVGPRLVERLRPSLDLTAPPAGSRRAHSPAALVDVNRADSSELVELSGIGPVIAGRIVSERRRGAFSSLDDLTRVRGVGPATVDRLRGAATANRRRP